METVLWIYFLSVNLIMNKIKWLKRVLKVKVTMETWTQVGIYLLPVYTEKQAQNVNILLSPLSREMGDSKLSKSALLSSL